MTPEALARVEGGFVPTTDGRCAVAAGGMVATAFPAATEAGVEMLRRGGNAIDAACAAAFALGVCEPAASGLGGQSMAIVSTDGRMFALDGSSRVPSLANAEAIGDGEDLMVGHRATTVPATPALLDHLNHRYGRLPIRDVLEPAIRIAREGYAITELQNRLAVRERAALLAGPGGQAFLRDDGEAYGVGETFRQPVLADLLEHLAAKGVKSLYLGEPAAAIDADMRAHDGFLRADDLAYIPWPVERRSISRRYRSAVVHTLPPPGAGQTLLLVLMILGHLPRKFLRKPTAKRAHFQAETIRKALLARKDSPVDPARFRQIEPDRRMLRRAFARELAETIRDEIDPSLPLADLPTEGQSGETTHLSVIRASRNSGNALCKSRKRLRAADGRVRRTAQSSRGCEPPVPTGAPAVELPARCGRTRGEACR
jgi:gamma-glutamyltranspeptidase/glutathione hydrolase